MYQPVTHTSTPGFETPAPAALTAARCHWGCLAWPPSTCQSLGAARLQQGAVPRRMHRPNQAVPHTPCCWCAGRSCHCCCCTGQEAEGISPGGPARQCHLMITHLDATAAGLLGAVLLPTKGCAALTADLVGYVSCIAARVIATGSQLKVTSLRTTHEASESMYHRSCSTADNFSFKHLKIKPALLLMLHAATWSLYIRE